MIFSDSPQQRALERMMTAVPRFLPQGGGIMVLHRFEYTAEMCDCRYCPYYRGILFNKSSLFRLGFIGIAIFPERITAKNNAINS